MQAAGEQHNSFDLSALPSVDLVLSESADLIAKFGRSSVVDAARKALDKLRSELLAGEHSSATRIDLFSIAHERVRSALDSDRSARLRRVINATGVVIHTNLGRAPLSENAVNSLVEVARGYSNLEYDVAAGVRGKRGADVESLICTLIGAEAAIIVNNCAAAAFFVLSAFAAGREVIVSRGELVEIGGDFRVPDVLERSGATLHEVGTTNRTKAADYAKAIGDATKMILRVHPSNYRIVGFTAAPSLDELVTVAGENNVVLFEDIGSGAVADVAAYGVNDEPSPRESIKAGVDIVAFSGDKLLGGPQSGIIAGRSELIDKLRKHPLYRALRVDKLTLAALGATLEPYVRGTETEEVPVIKMLAITADDIRSRAAQLVESLAGNASLQLEIIEGNSAIGGGSAPTSHPETWLISVSKPNTSADSLAARLRQNDPPIITRIENDRVLIDLRTVSHQDEAELVDALRSV
ncbi:MAG: L-seryl-tRNA(Sec) selenium transferase [Blastocatellia bacterium]|nr:L-seryl-tRNA(Sec) selenium transferase [Blastocatellia bacterium]